ncbi:IS1/IS1595 family N-terminal zinc-binding domain-containing protein, partial [Bifidobacterium tibiigranuli]
MRKNGRTAAGAQRWKCPECDAGMVAPSVNARRLGQLEGFVAWLRGGHSLEEQGRSFRRHTAWCWQVEPLIDQPPSKRRVLMTDGTYIAHNHCLLVLMDGDTGEVAKCRWRARDDRRL